MAPKQINKNIFIDIFYYCVNILTNIKKTNKYEEKQHAYR